MVPTITTSADEQLENAWHAATAAQVPSACCRQCRVFPAQAHLPNLHSTVIAVDACLSPHGTPAARRLALSKAQLYDAYVQHGYADPGSSEWATSVGGLVAAANRQAGGSPLQGADERAWLRVSSEPPSSPGGCAACTSPCHRCGGKDDKLTLAAPSACCRACAPSVYVQQFLEHRRAVLLRGGSDWAQGV